MWTLLQEYQTSLNNYNYNQYLNYSNFNEVKQKLNDKYK